MPAVDWRIDTLHDYLLFCWSYLPNQIFYPCWSLPRQVLLRSCFLAGVRCSLPCRGPSPVLIFDPKSMILGNLYSYRIGPYSFASFPFRTPRGFLLHFFSSLFYLFFDISFLSLQCRSKAWCLHLHELFFDSSYVPYILFHRICWTPGHFSLFWFNNVFFEDIVS